MTILVPFYLCDRDVLHSYALWPPDVRALKAMWDLPARRQLYGLATWERRGEAEKIQLVGDLIIGASREPKEEEQR